MMKSEEFIVVVCAFLIAVGSFYIPMFIGLPILVNCIFFTIIYCTIIQKSSKPKVNIERPKNIEHPVEKYCFMCGKLIEETHTFCKHCGINLKLRGK